MTTIQLNLGPSDQKKVAVISHERSGTHFLMNTLALNFGYIIDPWWNFDFEQGLNFHAPHGLLAYLKQVHDKPVLNILKSHHQIDFFRGVGDYLQEQFFVFYIYRDPRDVMVSNWKLINQLPWDEGPKTRTVSEFIRSAPRGAMLRYQKEQEQTLLHRWQTHVEGWIHFAESKAGRQLIVIRYEELNLHFDAVVKAIGARIGHPVETVVRPSRDENVVGSGAGLVNSHAAYFTDADKEYVNDNIGPTLERLGYGAA